jgi:LysR family cyn operon transcriptional activator
MELRHIRYFVRAAELLHFTHAAESLYISQPTLSVHIQQLEEELGAPLFSRVGRQVRLTEAGEMLLKRGRQAMRELDLAQEEIADLQGILRGTLRLGALFSFSHELLPNWLIKFHKDYPQIQVMVYSAIPPELEQALLAGSIDLALSFLPADSQDIEAEELFLEEIVLIVKNGSPLAGKEFLEEGDLSGLNMVLPGTQGAAAVRRLIDRHLAREKIPPKILMEMNDINALLTMTEKADCATVLSRMAVGNRKGISLLSLTEEPVYTTAGVMWLRAVSLSPAAKAFLKVIKSNLPETEGNVRR